jgi:endonuclease YncB( thermonuclease family)
MIFMMNLFASLLVQFALPTSKSQTTPPDPSVQDRIQLHLSLSATRTSTIRLAGMRAVHSHQFSSGA